jgi:hypothetical protein
VAHPVSAPARARATALLAVVLFGGASAAVFYGGVRPAARKGRELIALRENLRAQCEDLRAEIGALDRERVALETDWFYNERLRRLVRPEGAASWAR